MVSCLKKTLTLALAGYHGVAVISRAELPGEPLQGHNFSAKFLRSAEVLPLSECDGEIAVAMTDPGDSSTIDSIKMLCNKPVRSYAASRSLILDGIDRLYAASTSESDSPAVAVVAQWSDRVEDSPIAKRVNDLVHKAVVSRASDVHLEQGVGATRVRFRIDGVLHDIESLPPDTGAKCCARIKLISNLDVAERRLPQGGRFELDVDGHGIDLRVSSMPISGGESVVLRILHRTHTRIGLDNLGFSSTVTDAIDTCLRRGHGLMMVTGPTGSGKSTTLYSALEKLNCTSKKLITVEDPVEYDLAGVNQIQVKPDLDFTFAAALRSVLRQDPDIVMVGEVRDRETAAITIQAALTGHLVLTTVHTNDAAASFARLLDMDVEPYLLAATITGVLAQRLVRRLCMQCRVETTPDPQTAIWLGDNGGDQQVDPVYKAVGCERCAGTGYFGRTAVGEFIAVGESMSRLIRGEIDIELIRADACRNGTVLLRQDAARRVQTGETSMDEILRCVG
ncbi:GspE/PulE family protein [Gammaproteobacteria bacterium]|nr:GspE/PulE family protein [Gammaproteobacteria bacterium]